MNLFRPTKDAPLDMKYLRVCSVYHLLKTKRIGKERALTLLAERHSKSEMDGLRATVELWRRHPLPDMLP